MGSIHRPPRRRGNEFRDFRGWSGYHSCDARKSAPGCARARCIRGQHDARARVVPRRAHQGSSAARSPAEDRCPEAGGPHHQQGGQNGYRSVRCAPCRVQDGREEAPPPQDAGECPSQRILVVSLGAGWSVRRDPDVLISPPTLLCPCRGFLTTGFHSCGVFLCRVILFSIIQKRACHFYAWM
jgi:hypothetical protein